MWRPSENVRENRVYSSLLVISELKIYIYYLLLVFNDCIRLSPQVTPPQYRSWTGSTRTCSARTESASTPSSAPPPSRSGTSASLTRASTGNKYFSCFYFLQEFKFILCSNIVTSTGISSFPVFKKKQQFSFK